MELLQDPKIKRYTLGHTFMYESIFLFTLYLTFGVGWLWLLWGFKAATILLVIACFCPYPRDKNLKRMPWYSLYLIPALNIFLLCIFGWHIMPGFISTYFISLSLLTGKQLTTVKEMDEEYTSKKRREEFFVENKIRDYWDSQDPI